MTNKKVFVFGIDGAPPELIFKEWLDDLPVIKKLMQQGAYAELNSTIPPVSAVAWTTICTGKSPSDYGVFEYFYRKDKSYTDLGVISANNIQEKSIWQIASEHGKKSIVCLIPLTWPIKPFNGSMITGFLTPGIKSDYTYPLGLKQEIESLFSEPFMIDIEEHRNLSKKELLEKVYTMTDMHFKLMKYLIKNKEWNLFLGMIMGSDRLNHNFFRYADKNHRKYEPDSEFKNTLKDYYKYLDKNLGELIELLDEDTKIIVLSDHGIKRMHTRINLSDWLIQEGYLVLKEPVNGKIKLEPAMIDWEKTRVFAFGAFDGQIFINLKGRDSSGIVDEKQYEELIEELEEKFKKIPGDNGKILNTKIFKKKEHFRGKCQDIAPDMIVYFDDLQYGCNTSLIGNDTLWSPQTAKGSDDAGHSQKGIFITNESEQKGYIGEIDILDVAPTILNELNVKIPEDIKGRVL
jgi:predicted AlkP superfamily phosphohydrolase/phosphomutase